jgi:hypothetical protein
MKRSVGIALVGVAVALAACSSKTTAVNQPTESTSGAAAAPSAVLSSTTAPANPAGHVGDALNLKNLGGTPVAVTLLKIINPATGKAGPPRNGTTFAATMLTIENTGTSPLKGDVNNDTSLLGSDNQTYKPDFRSVTECTDFNNGQYQLGAGESATGCTVFVVPQGVTPAKVKYTPSSGFADNFGEWLIP